MISKIEFEHGEKTCAVTPGKFCEFFGTNNFGTEPICMYFYEPLFEADGWTQRCRSCLNKF